ncbi:MAG: ABC transporter permease, partial [Paramuribaculum sp.]|nr:ABC transporter permease [Paramuribaculum sp.]
MKLQIFDIENWREIGATLSRNRTRTFLTAFGIFWGTAMLALLLGGASGLKGLMMRNFNGVATNMGIVFPQRTTLSYRGFNKGLEWKLSAQDIEAVRRGSKAIEYYSALNYSGASVKYCNKSTGS